VGLAHLSRAVVYVVCHLAGRELLACLVVNDPVAGGALVHTSTRVALRRAKFSCGWRGLGQFASSA
jgi:hypothetical protein